MNTKIVMSIFAGISLSIGVFVFALEPNIGVSGGGPCAISPCLGLPKGSLEYLKCDKEYAENCFAHCLDDFHNEEYTCMQRAVRSKLADEAYEKALQLEVAKKN